VVTISQQIEYVRQYLRRRRQVTFSQLACGCASRLEVVVTFIAVLELIKQNQLDVRQDALFGDITIASRVRYDAGSPAAV